MSAQRQASRHEFLTIKILHNAFLNKLQGLSILLATNRVDYRSRKRFLRNILHERVSGSQTFS
jgi:ABC-type transport system involved in cytochrome bd biosynthesis fused ATPase/permease subunit